jgi:hypothetical protein
MMSYDGMSGLKLGDGYPADIDREYTCNKKDTNYGSGVWCAELIAKDGWEIKYDW